MNIESKRSDKAILLCLLWGFLIPQITLALINLRAWTLISGEANNDELFMAIALFCFELALIIAGIFTYWAYRQRKIEFGWKLTLASFVIHVVYLWFFLINIDNIIPDSIQPWILNEGNVGNWNITLLMPAAFLSLYALTKLYFSRIKTRRSFYIVLLTLISAPILWYLLTSLMQPMWLGQFSTIFGIIFTTLLVVFFLSGIIQLCDSIIHSKLINKLSETHYIFTVLLGFAAPLGGLTLNKTIPFPVDFQATEIYVLTVINAFILLIKPNDARLVLTKLFLRCTTFPFIFYFFWVFLPFLPLSLFAVLALGAGFLMLTPLALGLFQAKITLTEYKLAQKIKGKQKALTISIAGFLILPTFFIIQAILDKNALNTSLNYFYSHNMQDPPLSASEHARSVKALVQLRDRKENIQLPYISGFYNKVVYGDLVLSDAKISRMYQLLTNTQLPEQKIGYMTRGRQNRDRFFRGQLLAPNTDVSISDIQHSTNDANLATVKLTLQNNSDDTHSLYVGKMDIPEGLFVTGLRLKIENEWVPGQIYDRKTALWVFEKITEVRRDPAIIYYKSARHVELRVYPFPIAGIREVEIDFAFHPDIDSQVSIDEHKIDFNPNQNSHTIITTSGKTLIDKNLADYSFTRTPYLHYILDYSVGTKYSSDDYVKKIMDISKELGISRFRISAANISVSQNNTVEMFNTNTPLNLKSHIDNIKLTKSGGLWIEQAIAKEISKISSTLTESTLNEVPIFVVIGGNTANTLNINKDISLSAWSWLVPDLHAWYYHNGNSLIKNTIQTNYSLSQDAPYTIIPVVALKQNSSISILPAKKSSIIKIGNEQNTQIFKPSTKQFAPISLAGNIKLTNSDWPAYANAWLTWQNSNLNPSTLESNRKSLLNLSKELGFILPISSYIVVESASQWEILKRKEEQSIDNHSALDFEEERKTSEPLWWVLLIGLLVFLIYRERNDQRLKYSDHF